MTSVTAVGAAVYDSSDSDEVDAEEEIRQPQSDSPNAICSKDDEFSRQSNLSAQSLSEVQNNENSPTLGDGILLGLGRECWYSILNQAFKHHLFQDGLKFRLVCKNADSIVKEIFLHLPIPSPLSSIADRIIKKLVVSKLAHNHSWRNSKKLTLTDITNSKLTKVVLYKTTRLSLDHVTNPGEEAYEKEYFNAVSVLLPLMRNVQKLDCSGYSTLTDEQLQKLLLAFSNLNSLNISGCFQLTKENTQQAIKQCIGLKEVDSKGTILDKDFVHPNELKKLDNELKKLKLRAYLLGLSPSSSD